MKNITIVGAGHVGLITAVTLAELGHQVTCYDHNEQTITSLKAGIVHFYEPDLNKLLNKNLLEGRLFFTSLPKQALVDADVVYLAVGTADESGNMDLSYIKSASRVIAENVTKNEIIVVTKSTVPVGTNKIIKKLIYNHLKHAVKINIISNPEFLREGTAIYDTFSGDRIIIGAECEKAASIIEEINKPFNIPIVKTDIESAEMIKFSSNAFLATKISFINEIANLCEKLGANIEDVAHGMGLDLRIGTQFLKSGIGFGGSCLPKDINGLIKIANEVGQSLDILESVIKVNNQQKNVLINKAKQRFGELKDKRVAILGTAFKPNTSDVRESVAIKIIKDLISAESKVIAFDPFALEETKKIIGNKIKYACSIEEAIKESDFVFITTDWNEIKEFPIEKYEKLMYNPVIFDGKNCYSLESFSDYNIEYYSIGRPDQSLSFTKK